MIKLFDILITILITISIITKISAIGYSNVKPVQFTYDVEREQWFRSSPNSAAKVLNCNVGGPKIQTKYSWYKDGQKLQVADSPSSGHRISWAKKGQTGSIEIRNLNDDDIAIYQCRAEAEVFGVFISDFVYLNEGAIDPFSEQTTKIRTVKVTEYDPLTLTCRGIPNGTPTPQVTWWVVDSRGRPIEGFDQRDYISDDLAGSLHFSYVTQFDVRNGIGYQCAASSNQLPDELKLGGIVKLDIEKRTKKWFGPKWMGGSPENIQVLSGQFVKLQCIFSGNPVPNVSWTKLNGHLPYGKSDYPHPTIMTISNVLPEDSGRYECVGKNHIGRLSRVLSVTVTATPYWVMAHPPPSVISVLEGESASLSCNASGVPKPTVSWTMNGRSINSIQSADAHKYKHEVRDNGQTLFIPNTFHKSSRVYQCNASSPLGYVFANIYLDVNSFPPVFRGGEKLEVNSTIKGLRSSDVLVRCDVIGAPVPVFKWFLERKLAISHNNTKYTLFSNGSLLVKNAQPQDDGIYRCTANNNLGRAQGWNALTVYIGSEWFLEPRTHYTRERNDKETLECKIVADPRLTPEYLWTKDDVMLNNVSMHELNIETSGNGKLTFTKLRAKNSGIYGCVADSGVDRKTRTANITVKDVPEKPIFLGVNCNSRERAILRWKRPFDNHAPITEYQIKFTMAFRPHYYQDAGIKTASQSETETYYLMLSPAIEYTFYVYAVNDFGRGEPGVSTIPCKTYETTPLSQPSNVTGQGRTPNNLVISWIPVPREKWGASDFRYVAYWQRQDVDNAKVYNRSIADGYANETTIHDQPTFKKYKIWVKAINSKGQANDLAPRIMGYSGEDEPSAAPEWFRAEPMLPTWEHPDLVTVRFTWKQVAKETVRGHFEGYRIEICSLDDASQCFSKNVSHIEDQIDFETYDLNAFKPMQKYTAKIRVFNQKYQGPSVTVEGISFEIGEGYPSKVRNLVVYATGSSSIFSKWDPPENSNGDLAGYSVTYHQIEKTFTTNIASNENHHLIEDMIFENLDYTVTVQAQTKPGKGEGVDRRVRTWPNQAPHKPKYKITNKNSSSITVEWILENSLHTGSSFFLKYSKEDSTTWYRTQESRLPRQMITINNLQSSTEYLMHVVVRDKDKTNESDVYYFITSNSTLSKEQLGSGHSAMPITSATWFVAVLCAAVIAVIVVVLVCVCVRTQGGKYPVKKKELERGHHLGNDEEKSFMEYQYGST